MGKGSPDEAQAMAPKSMVSVHKAMHKGRNQAQGIKLAADGRGGSATPPDSSDNAPFMT